MIFRLTTTTIAAILTFAVVASAEREITINIYNDGFSQITEKRTVELDKSQETIELYDIAEKIDPGSITISSNDFDVKWIDYKYDFISAERLLYKFIGSEIQIQKGDSLITGILVRYDKKYLFVASQGWPGPISIYEREDLKNIDLPTLPEGLVSRPTIGIGIDSKGSGKKDLTLSYLTSGLGWQAEYHLEYDGGEKGELSAWISLDNQCGLSFPRATLVLVAGQVERGEPSAGAADKFEEGRSEKTGRSSLEPLVDYHRFRLPFEIAVGEKESKQAALFLPMKIDVDHYYKYQWSETKSAVKSIIAFKNDEKSGLGFPLPPGRIGIIDKKTDTFLGSGDFEGTPAGEEAEVFMGTAFDIKVERKRIDHRKLGRNRNADSFEIQIRNHKSEDVKLIIVEELYGYWEIVEKSDDYTKKDFQTIEFEVTVPAGSEKEVTYTVEYGY